MSVNAILLRWIETAGFHLRYGDRELPLAPCLYRMPGTEAAICARLSDFRSVSAILVFHGHFDHAIDTEELAQLSGFFQLEEPISSESYLGQERFIDESEGTVNW